MASKEKPRVEFNSKCPRGRVAAGFSFKVFLPALLVETLLQGTPLCSCLGPGLTLKHS